MTGDERLAKVAEVLAATIEPESYRRTPPPDRVNAYVTTLAQALEPLVTEWQAEDEARALREFTSWVAINRAFNGSDYKHGQSLYNECLNAALPKWAADYAAERDAGER